MSIHHNRIHAAFAGKHADRVPICEQAFASSVASEILGYEAFTGSTDLHYLEARAWMQGQAAHDEFVEKVYQDTVALNRKLDFDILHLPWRMETRPTRQVDEYTFLYGEEDGDDWSLWSFDPVSRTYGLTKSARPAPGFEEVQAIMRKVIAEPPAAEPILAPMLARAQKEFGNTLVVSGSSGMAVPMKPGWLEATILDPGLLSEYLDRVVEGNLAMLEAQAKAGIFLINGGGDFAFNSGPAYSPAFFDEVMAPRWTRMFDHCRELGVYYVMRSDGNLWPVADALFGRAKPHAYYECDYDAGMHFDELRKAFPELVLMGNVSCDLLQRGTPDEVNQRARECIQAAAPRVILASANSILHGTPPENVYALYDAAKSG